MMIGHIIGIHDGKEHLHIYMTDDGMVGHRVGEFVSTSNYWECAKDDKQSGRWFKM